MKFHRAILVYLGSIVLPVCGLVWLGVQSFERQRQALDTLRAEKLAAEMQTREQASAEMALTQWRGPIARYFFRIEGGVVVQPALAAGLPDPMPPEFQEAQRHEDSNQSELALEAYRKLFQSGKRPALALRGVARTLAKLGRAEEARTEWEMLAVKYRDERDPAHRPYGIVAAMAAGKTDGLYEKISAGKWELSADQAEYFLAQLDPKRTSAYLNQFHFARALEEQFRPQGEPHEGQLYRYAFSDYRVFYRSAGPDRIEGLAVNEEWVRETLRPQVELEIGGAGAVQQEAAIYGGAIALVLVVLSAGIALLLRDATREAHTSRLRSDFVSGVSHELKTPITLIRLYGDTLIERPELGAKERSDFYRIIVRESERLTRLVNQVLTFSRVERGVEQYNMEVGDLAPAVAHMIDDYAEYLQTAGFTLRRELAESLPQVRFDATAVLQAVANLLDNAVKYSGESREITVRLSSREGSAVFEVEDHGFGIPTAEQQKIFERFYRVNGSGKGGYGLGLFLVRHIMTAHGGRVEVESEPGGGSRFRLVFPVVS